MDKYGASLSDVFSLNIKRVESFVKTILFLLNLGFLKLIC